MRHRTTLAALAIAASIAGVVAVDAGPAVATRAATAAAPEVSVVNTKSHLAQFSAFATSNGGNRYSGSGGFTASLSYVEQKLVAAGSTVTRQTCRRASPRAGP